MIKKKEGRNRCVKHEPHCWIDESKWQVIMIFRLNNEMTETFHRKYIYISVESSIRILIKTYIYISLLEIEMKEFLQPHS